MINYDKVAAKIFSIIKGHGFNLSMFAEDGMDTSEPEDGRRFYVKKPNFMITLDEENDEIKLNKNSNVTLEEIEGILKQIKNLAKQNLLNTQIKVFGKEIAPKDFAYQAHKFKDSNMNGISEGTFYVYHKVKGDRAGPADYDLLDTFDTRDKAEAYKAKQSKGKNSFHSTVIRTKKAPVTEASLSRMSGSKKTSYQTLESVKLIVRHKKVVDEDVRGSRSRQISAIFLEQAGERFRFPHNHLAGARAMARHMYEGGNIQDTLGEYIVESVSNLMQLAEFVRYTRTNKLINENSEDVIKIVKENIATLRGELKSLTGAKSYTKMSEAISARESTVLEEDDVADLQDMFTVHKFDEKFGQTLPLVRKLMNEKAAWRAAILEASQQTIYMKAKEELSEEDIMEFENPIQQVGYKIGKLARRMVESDNLSKFVGKVAAKLIEGETISDFEKTVVRNVMENAKVEGEECKECGHADCPGHCDEHYAEPEDTVESIGDAFELKMKMIEHEEIFEDPASVDNFLGKYGDTLKPVLNRIEDNDKECVCKGKGFLYGKHGAFDCPRCKDKRSLRDKVSADEVNEEESKKTACSKCNGTGREPGNRDPRFHKKMFSAISCSACKGYGYGTSGDPARSLGKVKEADAGITSDDEWNSSVARGESESGAGMGYPKNAFDITNKAGKVIGEVGIDPDASPGNGSWYAEHFDSGLDVVGFDSKEEAEAEVLYSEDHVDQF